VLDPGLLDVRRARLAQVNGEGVEERGAHRSVVLRLRPVACAAPAASGRDPGSPTGVWQEEETAGVTRVQAPIAPW
jgi:hypothetical protein